MRKKGQQPKARKSALFEMKAKNQQDERFSSFESPAHSQKGNEEFSDYQTSRQKGKNHNNTPPPPKRQRSAILVQQLPLQCGQAPSSRKKQVLNAYRHQADLRVLGQQYEKNTGQVANKQMVTSNHKQNTRSKFNYLRSIEGELAVIRQETRQWIGASASSPVHPNRLISKPNMRPSPSLNPFIPAFSLQRQSYAGLIQQQRYQIVLLQQQNLTLREQLVMLQKEMASKQQIGLRREAQLLAQKMAANYGQIGIRQKQKQRIDEQAFQLQRKCEEMREQMRGYKQKQEQIISGIMHQKQEAVIEALSTKRALDYQRKFTEVFLNMIEKLPVDLQDQWSEKRKIAVGWKVVKHLVKKALKLGIRPPSISPSELS